MSEETTFTFTVNEDATILIELPVRGGRQQVSTSGQALEEVAKISRLALNNAMNTVYSMGRHVSATVKAIPVPHRPSTVEAEFSLKLDAEGNAFVAKGSAETTITIKMSWNSEP